MPPRNADSGLVRIYLKDGFEPDSPDHFDVVKVLPLIERSELADAEIEFRGNPFDPAGRSTHWARSRALTAQLAKAIRAWSFTRAGADGAEEPWPLPADAEGRAAAVHELGGPLGIWMGEQVNNYYMGLRIAPADPTNGTASSSTTPAPSSDAPLSPIASAAGPGRSASVKSST
jgi:hypothetical protein